jgi:hypothetical protein
MHGDDHPRATDHDHHDSSADHDHHPRAYHYPTARMSAFPCCHL